MTRLIPLVVALGLLVGCGGGSGGSPTTPTPTPTPSATASPTGTRTIALEGDLNFGNVIVGRSAEKVIRILNRGTATLTVSSLSGPTGGAFTASWTDGTIQASQWRDVTVHFAPTTVQSYSGTMTVNGDQASGTNTMAISARGVAAPATRAPAPTPVPAPAPAPPPPTQTTQSFTLTGTVRAGGAPLSGAGVEIRDGPDARRETVTDPAGNYTLSGLRGGQITVRAFKNDHGQRDQSVNLTSGTTRLDFVLDGRPSAPAPSSCSVADGPYTWDSNVQRCRERNGRFARSACCGR